MDKEGFTSEELSVIRRMLSTPDLYMKLAESLFPTIHGHSNIKSSILLMLVGGISKSKDIKLRGDINILLVGDPGTAKSQFLKQTSTLNPRSIYTSGKSSSAAGLTAAVIKDGETGEFTIEAGALMLSDQGVCCIDEFDKMNYKDQVSIHEAMEQQTITISKAGINATLNSRTSILAAANPVRGRYDKRKTLKQNVNLSPPIMSRFDLYFVLIDEVDAANDRNVSRYILQNHLIYNSSTDENSNSFMATVHPFTVEEVKLYIRYVKEKTTALTEASKKELVEKYNQLRQDSLVNSNNYRMTVRHLESMVRLSEALAKIHNDPEVSTNYILEAFRLIKSSLVEIRGEDIVLTCKTSMENSTLSARDISKITTSLIYLLKSSAELDKKTLIEKYCEMVEETFENVEMFENEKVKCEMVIDFLIENEGVLFEIDGILHIHQNYDY
jgi:DNA replication licensing factor MCM6